MPVKIHDNRTGEKSFASITPTQEIMEPGAEYDPSVHNRRSLRLRGHNYAGEGVYFVTICTTGRRHWFGEVVNGSVALNDAGRAADQCWRDIPKHFPNVGLDEWVVMPDHVHGIIIMRDVTGNGIDAGVENGVGAKDFSPLRGPDGPGRPRGTSRTLGSIIRGFKIGVTKNMDGVSPWQRNYYDVIVRNDRALNTIRRYIRNNPSNWNVLYSMNALPVVSRSCRFRPPGYRIWPCELGGTENCPAEVWGKGNEDGGSQFCRRLDD